MARRTIFFTIVANNYLGYARTLMDSLLQHHPSSPRYVVLCDEPAVDARLDLLTELIPARDIGLPEYDAMAFWYDVMEFATAIKPACFTFFFERHPGCDIIYLDPDILVVNRLVHVERALADGASIVLTPHITAPLQDGLQPDDLTIMKSGVYNCGFFAAAPVQPARDFIRWWHDRCRRDAVVDIEGNRFTDQRWVDLAPGFVARAHILHHPAYNLAYWNLAHRQVRRVGADLLVDGRPLRFAHFSGVAPADRSVFSKHQTRFTPTLIGNLRPLFEHYIDLLHANGWAEFRDIPYAYGKFHDGRPIHPMMRWSFRRHEAAMAEDPFAANGESFDALEPSLASRGPPGITRVMHELWHRRRDLQRRFDTETAEGRAGFLQWFIDEGERTENFDAASIRAAAQSLGPGEAVIQHRPWPPQDRELYGGQRANIDAWLAEPVRLNPPVANSVVPIPRHLALLWEDRPDLQQHFAIHAEAELSAFLAWCLTFGLKEGVVDVTLIEPSVAPFLDEITDDGEAEWAPVTRMMQMLAASYSGEFPQAAKEFPASAAGRGAIVLWSLTVASVGFAWPLGFIATPLAWCRRRAPAFADHGPPITNLLHTLWTLRTDVRELCNLGTLDGQMRLIAWAIGYGMRELRVPLDAVSDELFAFLADSPDPDVPEFRRFHAMLWASLPHVRAMVNAATPAGKQSLVRLAASARNDAWDFGYWIDHMRPHRPAALATPVAVAERVLVTGLVGQASGRGEDARLTAAALRSQSVAVTLLDRTGGALIDAAGSGVCYPVNIVHHNADSAPGDYVFLRRAGQHEGYTIGYWAWELARLPAQWHNSFAFYDEIWASTRFAFEAIRAVATKPVFLMPMPVRMPDLLPDLTRADFGLPADRFLFFFGFDLRSFLARKNPQAAVAAFRSAFPPGDDGVGLVIKTLGATDRPASFEELAALVADDPRIVLQDREYSAAEHATLVQGCDCYLSLHRSEGFGRGPAEAMLLGKPVIATGYSGNLDFMTPENSLLVDYRLVPVRPGEYPGWEDQEWADPDLEQAARHMRAVREDPALARRLGAAAARDIARDYCPETIGRAYLARLRKLPVALPFLPAEPVSRAAKRRAASRA